MPKETVLPFLHEEATSAEWTGDLSRRDDQVGVREDLPSGTVTFLFTDVAGSTKLLHEHGEGYADLLAAHRDVVRTALSRTGSRGGHAG